MPVILGDFMMTCFTSLSAPSPVDRPDPQRQVPAAVGGHVLGRVFYFQDNMAAVTVV